MKKVTLQFRNKEITLECEDAQKITELATRYQERLADCNDTIRISDAKAALITGIKMEYEIEMLKKKHSSSSEGADTENLIETLNHVTLYINALSKKLENS